MARFSALIFGGSGGIGSELAHRMMDLGWEVFIAARGRERLEAVSRELGAQAIVADATKPDEVAQAFASVADSGAPLSAVANCVGSILLKPAHLTSDEEWLETIQLNLTSSFYVLRESAKAMRRNGGAVALLSSAAASVGLPSHEAIAAAKAGVEGLARSAAATYAPAGLRVNVVAPGLVETELAKRITANPQSRKVSEAMHPLGRLGTPSDIASALAWVLDPVQSWVTGQVLAVDGGLANIRGK